ncbi:MAG: glycosyltransferase, partial [Gluconacetobacter diazotrophicus]|nr:glycosyltransferase [Gluconacetobacter diazotrophicus]
VGRTQGADGFELHADVPDIRPYFWNASAYVVPMRFGGGVRQKIFEAWSMRVPMVCTTMATEGTDAAHGVDCWQEDDPDAFASRLAGLLAGTEAQRGAVVDRAQAHASVRHSVPVAAPQFARLVERAAHIRRQRPYRLLFDLRWMEIGRAGGMEQMAHELVGAVGQTDHRNAYRVLCPRNTFHEWSFPSGFSCRPFFTDKNEVRAEALRAGVANALSRELRTDLVLTPSMRALRQYRKMDFDLVHAVCSYSFPDLIHFPTVLTVHDLQHVHFPEFFTPEDWTVRDDLYRSSCAAARHILCISEFTRQDLHRCYGVPLEKMTTVWNIPSRTAWLDLSPARGRALRAGMGVTGRYLFYPAHDWPHKNHARLVASFGLIAKDLPADVRLVFTGRPFAPDHPARAAIAEHRLEKRVAHLGYRSPLEMRALYQGALALVFPSLFEGFGMPAAEAMIAGCPVACANTTSLPEITGDAAVTFDPLSTNDMAAVMLRLVHEPALRENGIAAGHRRRTRFSARSSAIKTLAVYRRAFEEFYALPS